MRARAQRNLRVFAAAVRAAARMRVDAARWAGHEKTRLRLVRALEDTRRAAAAEELEEQQQQLDGAGADDVLGGVV